MLDCATCHEAVATDSQAKGEPAMPIDRCFGCHSDYDIDTPVAKCASCHSANSIKTDPAYPFPHKPHADMLDCTGCHQGAQGIHPKGTTRMPVDRCFGCHTEYGVDVPAAKCTACHAVDMKNVRPPDHKSAWPIEHGIEARWRVFAQHGKDCELCHRNDACIACHKTTRPRSHTGLWRNRTHGTNAAWDRDSCKTCHETGQCIRCHQTTKPMNHRGGWTSVHGLSAQTKSNEHCFVCHKSGWCESCHRGK